MQALGCVLSRGSVGSCRRFGKVSRSVVLVCATLGLVTPGVAQAAVGAMPGHFSLTPSGRVVYQMPLPAPGGAGGLAPTLSLVYESGSGLGLLGWNAWVGGMSAIRRCGGTYLSDGQSAPVDFTDRDRFA